LKPIDATLFKLTCWNGVLSFFYLGKVLYGGTAASYMEGKEHDANWRDDITSRF